MKFVLDVFNILLQTRRDSFTKNVIVIEITVHGSAFSAAPIDPVVEPCDTSVDSRCVSIYD